MKGVVVVAGTFLAVTQAQLLGGSMTSNDLDRGGCQPYTLIWARASSEQGNMVCFSYRKGP
jgi:hypothetical protein